MGRKKAQLHQRQQHEEQQRTALATAARLEQATRSLFKKRMAIAWSAMPNVQPEAVDATANEAFERLTVSMAVIHRAGKAGPENMKLLMETTVSLFEQGAGLAPGPTLPSTPGTPAACHCPLWLVALGNAIEQYDPNSDPVSMLEFLYYAEIVTYEILLVQLIWRWVSATVETTRACIARVKQHLGGDQETPRAPPTHPLLELTIDVIIFAVASGMKVASAIGVLCRSAIGIVYLAAYQQALRFKKKMEATMELGTDQRIEVVDEEGGVENDAIEARPARLVCGVTQWIACDASNDGSSEDSELQTLNPATILVTTAPPAA